MPTEWLQYGSFGLLFMLVVWAIKYGMPKALKMHEDAIRYLAESFAKESDECRKERQNTMKNMTDGFQKLVLQAGILNRLDQKVSDLEGKIDENHSAIKRAVPEAFKRSGE